MINGAHSIVYSTNPEADRTFLREVLRLPHVDAGGGWLIFGLPPAEVAVHPADEDAHHELYLMCDDVDAFVREMAAHDVSCAPVTEQRWGLLTEIALPGGGKLGVYQPRHARPPQAEGPARSGTRARAKPRVKARSASKKSAARSKAKAKPKAKAKAKPRR
jgi:hypothetical protein